MMHFISTSVTAICEAQN